MRPGYDIWNPLDNSELANPLTNWSKTEFPLNWICSHHLGGEIWSTFLVFGNESSQLAICCAKSFWIEVVKLGFLTIGWVALPSLVWSYRIGDVFTLRWYLHDMILFHKSLIGSLALTFEPKAQKNKDASRPLLKYKWKLLITLCPEITLVGWYHISVTRQRKIGFSRQILSPSWLVAFLLQIAKRWCECKSRAAGWCEGWGNSVLAPNSCSVTLGPWPLVL